MRLALAESNYDTAEFWLGISLGISVRMNYCEDVLSINGIDEIWNSELVEKRILALLQEK